MSSTRHAVMRGPSFTGVGKRPALTPAHQVDLLTGIIAGMGVVLWHRRRFEEGVDSRFGVVGAL